MKSFYRTYIECQCEDPSHVLRFTLDYEDGALYVETHLTTDVWYKRIWLALKYIFGKKSKFGEFSETLLNIEDYSKIRSMLEKSEKIFEEKGL